MLTFLSKIHPVCHNIANGIEPGSDSKTTDKHAADCSKAACWGRYVSVICVRCINCSYNNIAKGFRLLDTIAIFVYIGKIIQVRAF